MMYNWLLAFSTVWSGWGGMETRQDTLVFNAFPLVQSMKPQKLFRLEEGEVVNICLLGDSVIMAHEGADVKEYHFNFYSMRKRHIITSAFKVGRRNGQSLGFLGNSYGFSGRNLWVHDVTKEQFFTANIDSILNHGSYTFSETAMSYSIYSLALPDTQTAVVFDNEYESEYKLQLMDISTQSIIRPLTAYPKEFSRADRSAFEGFVFMNPAGTKCVLAARYADRIEICNLESGENRIVKGPENYEPAVKVMRQPDGREIGSRYSKTRFAFSKCKTTDRYIYILYSGNNHLSSHGNDGKNIYVYDWEGNPVKKIVLKNYVHDFAVSADESTLYVYNPQTKYIETGQL